MQATGIGFTNTHAHTTKRVGGRVGGEGKVVVEAMLMLLYATEVKFFRPKRQISKKSNYDLE